MSTSTNNRSYAGVLVALLALCLVLGGTALAAPSQKQAAAGGLTKAQKKQVVKIAKRMANKQIKKKAANLSVKHAKSADTASTAASAQTAISAITAGSAVTAGSAGTAGSAASALFAANAGKISDLEVKKFSKQVVTGGAAVELVNVAGFLVTATCPAGIPTINGAADGGKLRFQSISTGDTIDENGSSNLSAVGLTMTSGQDLGTGYAEYTSPTDQVASVWYGWREDGGTCFLFGNAIGG